MATEIMSIFSAVPAGATLYPQLGQRLALRTHVIVEWQLKANTPIPDWLQEWPTTAKTLDLKVTLEHPTGTATSQSVARSSEPTTRTPTVLSAGTSGLLATRGTFRSRELQQPVIVGIEEAITASTNRVLERLAEQPSTTAVYEPIRRFTDAESISDTQITAATAQTGDQFLRAVACSKHPDVAQALGFLFAFDFILALPVWTAMVNQTSWLRVSTSFSKSDVLLPFTKTVLRQSGASGERLVWVPRSTSDRFAAPGREGLLRMEKWFLQSAEYFQENLQEAALGPLNNKWGKPHQDTGGLALGCKDIKALIELKGGGETKNNVPVLGWEELLAGLRPDVKATGGVWESLVRRTVKYPDLGLTRDDEGFIEVGSIHQAGQQETWLFEEVTRWDGRGLALPKEEDLEGITALSSDRPNPNARLRWLQEYRMRVRPVFKGGWGPSVVDVSAWEDATLQTKPFIFRREERVAAPPVEGLSESEVTNSGVYCSVDDGLPSRRRLKIYPPRVLRYGVKRSGVLDGLPCDEQGRLLKAASGRYEDPSHEGFPDPWVDRLRIQVRLFGTSPSASCIPVASKDREPLTRAQPKMVELTWRETKKNWPAFVPCELRIEASSQGPSTVEKNNDTSVTLRVAPGDLVNLHLSARISGPPSSVGTTGAQSEEFARFFRLGLGGMQLPSLVERLRRLIADSVTFDCRHATRAPLEDPEWTAPRIDRLPGEVAGLLSDAIRVDRQTTVDLVADATWQEWQFSGDRMIQVTKNFANSPSATLSADREPDYGIAGETTEVAPITLNLPFADTRRRDIELSLRARPRWGIFFKGGKEKRGSTRRLIVPSASQPPPPEIGLIVPAVVVGDTTSTEDGRKVWRHEVDVDTCRVYLGNRWFQTGPDEMVGVVCAPTSQTGLIDGQRKALKAVYTQWGAEVLLDTPNIGPGPFARHFPSRVLTFDGVTSRVGNTRMEPMPAVVAAHSVLFDEHLKEYFADIRISGHLSNCPWIRLVLARFQPESCEGLHLSTVAMAQFARVLSNQWIAVSESHRQRRLLRISASRTPAAFSSSEEMARSWVEATATLYRSVEPSEASTGEKLLVRDDRTWRKVCDLSLHAGSARQSDTDATYWLGECQAPKGPLLVEVIETIISGGTIQTSSVWRTSQAILE